MPAHTDYQILRTAIAQVLELDLTAEHGWKEGIGYHLGPPAYKPDLSVGDNLIARGILVREGSRLYLTEAALMRLIRVAMGAAISDLLANDPLPESLPEIPNYYDEGPKRLIFTGIGSLQLEVRG